MTLPKCYEEMLKSAWYGYCGAMMKKPKYMKKISKSRFSSGFHAGWKARQKYEREKRGKIMARKEKKNKKVKE